jgi:hypothetical protein
MSNVRDRPGLTLAVCAHRRSDRASPSGDLWSHGVKKDQNDQPISNVLTGTDMDIAVINRFHTKSNCLRVFTLSELICDKRQPSNASFVFPADTALTWLKN